MKRQDLVHGERTRRFHYDSMGRLWKEEAESGEALEYAYDRYGNRSRMNEKRADGKVFETAYSYDARNRLLSEVRTGGGEARTTRHSYDANGNQLGSRVEVLVPRGKKGHGRVFYGKGESGDVETSTLLEYNSLDQLVFSHRDGRQARYTYRADGLRYGKETWGLDKRHSMVTHFWDGDQVVAEMHTQKEGGLETAWANVHYLRGGGLARPHPGRQPADLPAQQPRGRERTAMICPSGEGVCT